MAGPAPVVRPRPAGVAIPSRRLEGDDVVTDTAPGTGTKPMPRVPSAAHCASGPCQSHWSANDSDLLPNKGTS
jgi:hypothetical protein